jgi:hypothetical protein
MSAASAPCSVRRRSCFAVIGLALGLNGRAAQPTETRFDFRIAAQPLDEALQEFSRQSGLQVIFFSSLTEGIQSPGVQGKHTVAEALGKLLAGSSLTFHLINSRTVSIRRAE